jgi:dynein heavy chain 2
MKSNVESRIKNYEQDLSKFEARWHQLKPNETALEGGSNAGNEAVKQIKEKKLEFTELEKTREDLV